MSQENENTPIRPKFDALFYKAALLRLIIEPHLCVRFKDYLSEYLFDTGDGNGSLRIIAKVLLEWVRTSSETPTVEGIWSKLQLLPDGEARETAISVFNQLRTDDELHKFSQSDQVFRTFLQWLKATAFIKEFPRVKEKFNSGSFDQAYDNLEKTLLNIKGITLDDVEDADWGSSLDFLETESMRADRKFHIGIEDFDLQSGFEPQMLGLFVAGTGAGKCLRKGTRVLMYSGETKNVEDIVAGELLMGPDSSPRTVLSTTVGREMMYEIRPTKGESWGCNSSHILPLKHTVTGEVTCLSVSEYLGKSNKFKHCHKLYRSGVEFTSSESLPLDPYLFGVWLGDGSRHIPEISNNEPEIIEYLHEFKQANQLDSPSKIDRGVTRTFISRRKKEGASSSVNEFWQAIKLHGLFGDSKGISLTYKTSSVESRLKLLAGLLDTDGYLSNNFFEITTKFDRLKEDILFLARSLGFAAYATRKMSRSNKEAELKPYWRISISGNINRIPCIVPRRKASPRFQKKDVLRTGFSVVPEGIGDYYGFELDGDHLFLLGDFTVAHNTQMTVHLIRKAIEQQKHIYVACVEDRKVTILRRIYSCLTGIPMDEIKRLCDMSPENRKKMYKASESLVKYVTVEFMYGVPLDFILSRVKEHQAIRRSKGLPPYEAMVIDYLQHIAHLSPGDSSHEKLSLSMAKYKDFVLQHNLVGITHQQVNRTGVASQNKEALITMAEMSASFQAAFVADVIISLNRTTEMKERDESVWYVCKGREGSVENKYQVKTEFDKARFNTENYLRLDRM